MEQCQVAIVGSGFAGTILARILHRLGLSVVLIERQQHPRFAIGESSTPLAAICLERLAKRYGFADLSWLAAYGRWLEHMPQNRRGLKRGFTFFGHRAGALFAGSPDNERRLLVAASPDDEVADCHWLRADIDHFLVRQAIDEGVDYRDRCEILEVEPRDSGDWRLAGRRAGRAVEVIADLVVDGTGAGGLLSRALELPSALDRVSLDTALVSSHFARVDAFAELSAGPYPDERAAVHHLIEEGWVYALPFDHGVVSAGVLLRRSAYESLVDSGVDQPEAIWRAVLSRYPSLQLQFARAQPVEPFSLVPRVQRLESAAAGPGWAMLPHTFAFFDPMFSTGIAWSLLGVERLAGILEAAGGDDRWEAASVQPSLERYSRQLQVEAKQMARLLEGAYAAMQDFELFIAQSLLYFATVSYAEVDQRLWPEGHAGVAPAWQGFLGAGDAQLEEAFAESLRRLASIPADQRGEASSAERESFDRWMLETIAPWNVGGFGDPRRRNLYPVDLDLLIDRAALLGMTGDQMRAKLPLLRGRSARD